MVATSEIPGVSAAVMAEVDRLAVDQYGIELLQMMEQAGAHLAEVVRLELGGDLRDRTVIVVAGPGNNGGGGLAAARHLQNRGAAVEVFLARPALRTTGAARHQLATLLAMDVPCCVTGYDLTDRDLEAALAGADVIVDALLGYSIAGAPRGEVEHLIECVLRCGRPVVSLDLPSGIDPDSGDVFGSAIRASATLTLALPKLGLLTERGTSAAGRLYLGDLGLPAALYAELGFDTGPIFATGPLLRLEGPA
ncbi:MAG TPA: NAD(P)H-hydrate epimerase [Candidatus Sulfomarinibacteraceae bacterium]|nr:NAD(P)H-hydrate epimerase [Candidatus Sulfomarinibacteraceae bacterium]